MTVNGQVPEVFGVRSGERIRLRLLNAANARIFGLEFKGHEPLIIALDGHPVEPHAPDGGRVVLGPAQRIDLILEFGAEPSQRSSVLDTFYKGLEYKLLDLVYSDEPPLPSATRGPATLPPHVWRPLIQSRGDARLSPKLNCAIFHRSRSSVPETF